MLLIHVRLWIRQCVHFLLMWKKRNWFRPWASHEKQSWIQFWNDFSLKLAEKMEKTTKKSDIQSLNLSFSNRIVDLRSRKKKRSRRGLFKWSIFCLFFHLCQCMHAIYWSFCLTHLLVPNAFAPDQFNTP